MLLGVWQLDCFMQNVYQMDRLVVDYEAVLCEKLKDYQVHPTLLLAALWFIDNSSQAGQTHFINIPVLHIYHFTCDRSVASTPT